jgi:hypothetical protein
MFLERFSGKYQVVLMLLLLGLLSCRKNVSPYHKGGPPQPIDSQAQETIREFQQALARSDWPRALACCTAQVQSNAQNFDNLEAFFQQVVPVEAVISVKKPSFSERSSGIVNGQREDTYYGWAVPLRETDLLWVCRVLRQDSDWRIEFQAKPLSRYIEEKVQEREQHEQWVRRQTQILRDKLSKVRTRLVCLSETFVPGKPILLRLELIHEGDGPLYYDDQQVAVNGSMTINNVNDKSIPYVGGPVQTIGGFRPVGPGQTVVLFDNFDITKQYRIARPGQYTVQFNGRGLSVGHRMEEDIKPDMPKDSPTFSLYSLLSSNSVTINVE